MSGELVAMRNDNADYFGNFVIIKIDENTYMQLSHFQALDEGLRLDDPATPENEATLVVAGETRIGGVGETEGRANNVTGPHVDVMIFTVNPNAENFDEYWRKVKQHGLLTDYDQAGRGRDTGVTSKKPLEYLINQRYNRKVYDALYGF